MTGRREASEDAVPQETTVTVRVPLAFRKRGGRKRVVAPDGSDGRLPSEARDKVTSLVKALARAHRWQSMLQSGDYASIGELAAAERINPSYLARVLRLTLFAPAMVECLLRSGQETLTLNDSVRPLPVVWSEQASWLAARSVQPRSDLEAADKSAIFNGREPTTVCFGRNLVSSGCPSEV